MVAAIRLNATKCRDQKSKKLKMTKDLGSSFNAIRAKVVWQL